MRIVDGVELDDGVDEPGTLGKCESCGTTTDGLFFDDDGDLYCADCLFEMTSLEK